MTLKVQPLALEPVHASGQPMSDPDEFHGLHVSDRQVGAIRLKWSEPTQRFAYVRVVRHTCDCRARIYELCASGGSAWIRRTDRTPPRALVRETHPSRTAPAEALWALILAGQAR
jgi:hypothetical protein